MLYFLEKFNSYLISFGIFPIIIFLGGLFTWKLRGLQFTGLKLGFKFMVSSKQASSEEGQISRYEAVAGILAGNFGTGNIAGMAVALACGGPGALVWIWVGTLLGAIVQYSGSFLGVKYRKFHSRTKEFIGGPTACLAYGLGNRFLASLFCLFTIITAFSAGNCVQINCIVPLCSDTPLVKVVLGVIIALTVVPVLIGGNHRILRFSAKAIPFIAGFYIISCFIILAQHSAQILPAVKWILFSAFGVQSAIAGLGGYTLIQVLSTGMSRAIMATDCGSGMVSILQSDSRSNNPVIDGLVTLLPPIIVASVCSITMLVLLVSGAYTSGLEGTLMVLQAFTSGLGSLGGGIVILAMALFGYTTILTWFACAEKSLSYIFPGKQANLWLKFLYVFITPLGGVIDTRLVWGLADTGFIGMVILNCIALIVLIKDVLETNQQVALLKLEKDLEMGTVQR
ncbi:alanine/glycine:cation symporter family protein [Chlamydia gallinacea]|uniref:Na+/alanine symporter n=2 Tax=Chlamydia gallinacea TaxID=1457153 RepID=A0A173DYI0_9CHLA|nr:amino acid carrier protein [Chlamydia gallinacea]ANG65956.1 Na+/alanine symporter [Chlamydia gallinacea 08-1274/3]EYE60735.1 amino acid carrier family protein [Bacteroides fragilis str. S6L5]MBX6680133.1 sodium:alanine symporter family protein [Chlamydia gallinacea]